MLNYPVTIILSAVISLISAIFVAGLGAFVLRQNIKSRLNILFGFFCASIFFWLFGTFMMFLSKSSEWAIFWDRFVYIGVVFLPILMHHFSLLFTKSKDKKQRYLLYFGYVLAVFFLIISRTDYFVKDLFFYDWGTHTKAQLFHHIFLGVFYVYILIFFFNVRRFYKTAASPLEKKQAQYIFAAFFFLIAVGTPAYLPAYGIGIFPVPFISGLLFTITLAYAIVKHRLFDIKFILRKGTVFALILAFITAVWLFAVTYIFKYLPQFWAVFIPSLVITVSFIPFKNFLEKITERYFFKKSYSFEAIVQAVSHNIPNTADLEVLLKNGMGYLISALKTESAAIAILIEKDHFISRSVIGWQAEHESFAIKKDSAIVQHLNYWLMEVLVRDEMDFEEGKEKEIHQKIKQELVDLKFALVAPILSKKKVVALLFLGDKKNKDAFTVQDVQLIDVICGLLGPAIENARLFEQTKELLEEVALANKAKSDFIDIVSHQFRAPLSVIRLQAEVLQDSLKKKSAALAAPEQQSLSKIYDHTLFLINLLSEIFDVLAIEGGKLVLDKKARFLWETVDEAVKEFSMAFAQKKIDVVWEREKIAPLETEYDEMKIRNVLKILLNNALKYTKDGGTVEVKLDKKEIAGKIYSWVTVKDNGVGIHIDDIDKVFAKFFRSEDAKIMAQEGTGLGLYIAKKFIEAHGGKIWLESSLGAGTAAHFILPIA